MQGFAALEEAASLEEFTAATGDLITEDVVEATTELDTYLREECRFGLTS